MHAHKTQTQYTCWGQQPPPLHTCIIIGSHTFYFSGSAGLALRRTEFVCHLSVCVLPIGLHYLPYVHCRKRINDTNGKISLTRWYSRGLQAKSNRLPSSTAMEVWDTKNLYEVHSLLQSPLRNGPKDYTDDTENTELAWWVSWMSMHRMSKCYARRLDRRVGPLRRINLTSVIVFKRGFKKQQPQKSVFPRGQNGVIV